jgi:PAS domain-containing protein
MAPYPPRTSAKGSKLELLQLREQLACSSNDSRQLTQAVAANVREGVAVFDHDLRRSLWSPCLEKVAGLAAQEVLGKKVIDLFQTAWPLAAPHCASN